MQYTEVFNVVKNVNFSRMTESMSTSHVHVSMMRFIDAIHERLH